MTYEYELWNGKKAVGYIELPFKLYGQFVCFEDSAGTGSRKRPITVPIRVRVLEDGLTYRVCLDVSKKSRKQISTIKQMRNIKSQDYK